jgi:tetratricopeptide (TPR) repeat protein
MKGPRTDDVAPVRTSISRYAGVVAAVLALTTVLGACSSSDEAAATGPCSGRVKVGSTDSNANETTRILNRALRDELAGNITGAEKEYREVVDRGPNKEAFFNLGLICQNAKNNTVAEEQYRLALAVDPKMEVALYNLAIVRTLQNDIPGAISLYRRAVAANAKDANAHYNLGLLLRGQGKTAEGNQEVQTGVNLDGTLRAKAIAQGVPLAGS